MDKRRTRCPLFSSRKFAPIKLIETLVDHQIPVLGHSRHMHCSWHSGPLTWLPLSLCLFPAEGAGLDNSVARRNCTTYCGGFRICSNYLAR